MSFFTSLTGLNAAVAELGVASNNIANSNTTSFKRSEAKFSDIFASTVTTKASTAFGSGVALRGIAQQFSQGGLQLSENVLDLAITGDGFFPMASTDGSALYTRNGSFMLNEENQIVNDSGYTLQVHPLNLDGISDFNQAMIPLVVDRNLAAQPTTIVNLDIKIPEDVDFIGTTNGSGDILIDPADATTFHAKQSLTLFDDAGKPFTADIYYQKIEESGIIGNATVTTDSYRVAVHIDGNPVAASYVAYDFDQDGNPVNIEDQIIPASPVDGRSQAITLNVTAVTHTSDFEIVDQTVNGSPEGKLVNINIEGDGSVMSTYSNGIQQLAGRINLASFSAPQGLTQIGDTSYRASGASGTLIHEQPGTSGLGTLVSGATERSNVDLTQELVNLISAQRNFQSNAKAMETSGTLTQTLINMRG
jgi:flagellar hook protein FlgE